MRVHELFDLLIRWFHVIAGIMWIGNSMLFNWLDRNLVKSPKTTENPLSQGEIWMLHSGAFYEVEKKLLPPGGMPKQLHWFKWQNGLTWISGIFLLMVVYYMNGAAFMVDKQIADVSPNVSIAIGVGVIVGSWLVYDITWRALGKTPVVPTVLTLGVLVGSTIILAKTLSGRAAYMHVGVVIGTLMTGNVWTVILPSQRALVRATESGKAQDEALSLKAKQRSIHNNYLTFPLLFIMVSNHFPSTWGDKQNWIILLVIMAAGAGVRHGMNLRYSSENWYAVVGLSAVAGLGALAWMTSSATWTAPNVDKSAPVSFATVEGIIGNRCRTCHSSSPTDELSKATGGVKFDTPEQIGGFKARILARVVELKNMPFANKTSMTDVERELVRRWIEQGGDLHAKGE